MKFEITPEDIRSISKQVLAEIGGWAGTNAGITELRKKAEEVARLHVYQGEYAIKDYLRDAIKSKISEMLTYELIHQAAGEVVEKFLEKYPHILSDACVKAIEEKFAPLPDNNDD